MINKNPAEERPEPSQPVQPPLTDSDSQSPESAAQVHRMLSPRFIVHRCVRLPYSIARSLAGRVVEFLAYKTAQQLQPVVTEQVNRLEHQNDLVRERLEQAMGEHVRRLEEVLSARLEHQNTVAQEGLKRLEHQSAATLSEVRRLVSAAEGAILTLALDSTRKGESLTPGPIDATREN